MKAAIPQVIRDLVVLYLLSAICGHVIREAGKTQELIGTL
jgi:hypothetical protein